MCIVHFCALFLRCFCASKFGRFCAVLRCESEISRILRCFARFCAARKFRILRCFARFCAAQKFRILRCFARFPCAKISHFALFCAFFLLKNFAFCAVLRVYPAQKFRKKSIQFEKQGKTLWYKQITFLFLQLRVLWAFDSSAWFFREPHIWMLSENTSNCTTNVRYLSCCKVESRICSSCSAQFIEPDFTCTLCSQKEIQESTIGKKNLSLSEPIPIQNKIFYFISSI